MSAARRRFTPVMTTIGEMWKAFGSLTQWTKILDEFIHIPQSSAARNYGQIHFVR
jgi:hypothetical protein